MKPALIYDIEIYKNYFLVSFMNAQTGNVKHFELYHDHPLDAVNIRQIINRYRLVSFNGNNFDLPILTEAICGATNSRLKEISDKIILNNIRPWAMGIESISCDHIDLIEVAPGIASLKIYGGRLHCDKLQDLPIEPDALIAPEQRTLLRKYCENDLRTTLALFNKLSPQIALRETMGQQYDIDLRSKSDAQIAEAVIRHEVEKLKGVRLKKEEPFRFAGRTFGYKFPPFLSFIPDGEVVRAAAVIRPAVFTIGSNGVVQMPKEVADLKIKIGESVYRMGIGGLHSSEKSIAHFADDEHVLVDRDVASYYPAIILNCNLAPGHMGKHFTHVYRSIVQRRLAAKHAGDKVAADSLKITINGSFGKFGSPYSVLYSPTLLIQTTVTGQLSLLMLIERLEAEGISVVSANTDGIVIRCHRSKLEVMRDVIEAWEITTGFDTEETQYRALYSRDVNNYIAIKPDNSFKLKGVFAPAALQKNPTNEICTGAVVKYLVDGSPIDETIRRCQDVTKFVTVRTVKGGAVKDGEYLGKAVRWYYAKGETGTINYKVNNYKVARSEGAKPMMNLPDDLPDDLDYDWYISEAREILSAIGCK